MTNVQRTVRFIFFSAWAVFMTALTYILGAPSLKVLRRRLGRMQGHQPLQREFDQPDKHTDCQRQYQQRACSVVASI